MADALLLHAYGEHRQALDRSPSLGRQCSIGGEQRAMVHSGRGRRPNLHYLMRCSVLAPEEGD